MHDGRPRPARAVSTLMAGVLGFLGASTLARAHSGAHGGLVPDAGTAMWMGGLYLALAGLPLGSWFRTPRAAGLWTAACSAALVACLAMAVRTPG